MRNFTALIIAGWIAVFVIGWALTAGRLYLGGHWVSATLITGGFAAAIGGISAITQGLLPDSPPRNDDKPGSHD
ncbi:hypothetical protein HOP60_01305 [Halomonas daqingensis]|uniref:Uncharacterized protein n=1 Tax=Billgrantia desiderata TaxID=52021 RepID=A0ABS9AZI6_9GAMM|nr:hypothetical protein [Halomonas desiderata]MCE8040789.1 hypothetical protein [Halomonas desiderata]MCE8045364.1 hypothetical protein [Halomonas desiderata]